MKLLWLFILIIFYSGPDKDVLKEYKSKVDFLRRILETFVGETTSSLQNVGGSKWEPSFKTTLGKIENSQPIIRLGTITRWQPPF